jgi:AcrR family transcriptional regulator
MVLIAAAVVVVIAQAYAAQAAKDKATVALRRAAALSEAQAQAEDAAQKALDALERIRIETAEQLAACRESVEQAEAAARAARTELEQVRDVAAKAASDVQQAVQVAIQQAITDRNRILAERVVDPGQHIKQAQDDIQGQGSTLRDQADAAEAMNEHLEKTAELVDAPNAENPEQKDEAMVAKQLTQGEPATARTHGISARRTPKMTPVLVDQAQRMYDSGDYTVADIAESFDVSPTTIYRYLRTRRAP